MERQSFSKIKTSTKFLMAPPIPLHPTSIQRLTYTLHFPVVLTHHLATHNALYLPEFFTMNIPLILKYYPASHHFFSLLVFVHKQFKKL